jgi:hypothetical protein
VVSWTEGSQILPLLKPFQQEVFYHVGEVHSPPISLVNFWLGYKLKG